jgi:hypothetical protein
MFRKPIDLETISESEKHVQTIMQGLDIKTATRYRMNFEPYTEVRLKDSMVKII